jgi:hypothetical protein
MAVLSAVLSFLGIALAVSVVVLLVWCIVAGIFHGAKIVSGYLWWVGSALFWIAVVSVIYFLFFFK